MSSYVLLHCYSDQNRGDAGIIESTIDLIKNLDSDPKITAVSVFHENDIRFSNDHYFTKKIVENVCPALFYEPYIKSENNDQSTLKKLFVFFKLILINFILFLMPYDRVARLILSPLQLKTFCEIKNSDHVISKGGSFLYSLKGLNGDFFLFRMASAFMLPIRLKKNICIFSQSVGPFENPISKHFLFFILRRMSKIYLREQVCLKYLPSDIANKVVIVPDSAFFLNEVKKSEFEKKNKIALTARPHKFSNSKTEQDRAFSKYISDLCAVVTYFSKENYQIFLVGQVTGPSAKEDDRTALKLIYENLDDTAKKSVTFFNENTQLMSPKELQVLYATMDLVIGTRLHSSIFSLAGSVPTINIAYHGTKSQGVMGSVNLGKYVIDIDKTDPSTIIDMAKELINNPRVISEIKNSVNSHRERLIFAMSEFLKEKR